MCLFYPIRVINTPTLNCTKRLLKCPVKKRLQTPYRYTNVREDGWIIPRNWGVFNDYGIEGGFIHAYYNTVLRTKDNEHYFDAYAVNVVAKDNGGELVCRALYVPSADKDYNSRRRNRNFFKKNPSIKEIKERFPFLKKRI